MPKQERRKASLAWPQVFIDAMAKGRHTRREVAAKLERDSSLISLYCSGRSVPRLSDRKLIDTLAGFLEIESGKLEELILAYRPSGKNDTNPLRIQSIADLRRAIDNDLSGVLRNIAEANGSGDSLAGRLREVGYEVPDGPEWASLLAGVSMTRKAPPNTDEKLLSLAQAIGGERIANETTEEYNNRLDAALTRYGRINERDLAVRDSVRAACRLLDDLFAAEPSDELPKKKIRDALHERFGWCTSPEIQRLHGNAILQALIACRYLEATPVDSAHQTTESVSVRRRWRLTATFVVNWLFGYSLAVPRLDFLLDGGLLLPAEHGLTILATGRPGAGKTSLILQIAASLAAEGFVGIFLAAEEYTSSLLDKLSYLGYERAPVHPHDEAASERSSILMEQLQEIFGRFQGTHRSEPARKGLTVHCLTSLGDTSSIHIEKHDDFGPPPAGCLILTGVGDRSSFMKQITAPEHQAGRGAKALQLLKPFLAHCAERGRRTVVVIDSLESVMPTQPQPEESRRMVEALFNFARNNSTITLLAGEKHTDQETPSFAEYLTDMHVHLGHATGETSTRVLSIMKSRHQSTIRGEHAYAIHGGYGLGCYPSIRAQLSVARRRIRSTFSPKPLMWKLKKLNFTDVLKTDVVAGDSILLTGPAGTHKFLIGLSFLASALADNESGDVLLISLRQDVGAVVRVIDAHRQLGALLKKPAGAAPTLHERVKLLFPPPDYFSGARFYEWMRNVYRKSAKKISRVLIHTMDQFKANSPLIAEEPMFFSLLIEYFKSHGTTSMFVLAEEADRSALPGADVFDAVLKTGKEPTGNVVFSVGHSGPCDAWAQHATLTHQQTEPKLQLNWINAKSDPEVDD